MDCSAKSPEADTNLGGIGSDEVEQFLGEAVASPASLESLPSPAAAVPLLIHIKKPATSKKRPLSPESPTVLETSDTPDPPKQKTKQAKTSAMEKAPKGQPPSKAKAQAQGKK